MANSWHGVQGYVVLGHLSDPIWETSADVQIELKHDVAALRPDPLVRFGSICPANHSSRLFEVAAEPFEPEERKVSVSDTALTPHAELHLQESRTHLAGAYPQNIWRIGSSQIDVALPELEFNGGWRRIWNRELLVQNPCVLNHCSWMETRSIQGPPEQGCETELTLDSEIQPVLSTVERFAAERLPAAQSVFFPQVQANAEEKHIATHLVGPRLSVEYDLPALQIKS